MLIKKSNYRRYFFFCQLILLVLVAVPISLHMTLADEIAVQTSLTREPLSVVASIKPLALIAKAALGSRADVTYLRQDNQSPHTGGISLSVLETMRKADMVVYVGDEFEPLIAKALKKMDIPLGVSSTQVIASAEISHRSVDRTYDSHVWLSPQKANLLAKELQRLGGIAPTAVITEEQFVIFHEQLESLSDRAYVTHHDMMSHFTQAFGLHKGIALRDATGKVKGARSQHRLRVLSRQQSASCVFVEPQYKQKDARVLARALDLPLREIDPMAGGQELTSDGYYNFLVTFIGQFTACFD
ncbi:metal ABC transporter substrate-binding protein [bacterium]|nr:metal ABC transporter substrate-binding protein [bacterium]